MSNKGFEKKLNKHKKKSQKCMCSLCNNDYASSYLDIPIDHDPPYKKSSIPNLDEGDLVSWKADPLVSSFGSYISVSEEGKKAGIVIDSHWLKVETSAKFSKKEGNWISDFVCVPHAVVLWNDGETTDVPMELLEKESGK